MKTEIKVTALEHGELVDLLSTALYGNNIFGVDYNKDSYASLSETHGECLEDKLADLLLAGHKITIIDYEAEGEKYSDKCVGFTGEGEYKDAVYEIGLQDFLDAASTPKGFRLLEDVLSGEGDAITGDMFLQRVVFGEEVYG